MVGYIFGMDIFGEDGMVCKTENYCFSLGGSYYHVNYDLLIDPETMYAAGGFCDLRNCDGSCKHGLFVSELPPEHNFAVMNLMLSKLMVEFPGAFIDFGRKKI